MDQCLVFNGVRILLTTAQDLYGVQAKHWADESDLVLSIEPGQPQCLRVLKNRWAGEQHATN